MAHSYAVHGKLARASLWESKLTSSQDSCGFNKALRVNVRQTHIQPYIHAQTFIKDESITDKISHPASGHGSSLYRSIDGWMYGSRLSEGMRDVKRVEMDGKEKEDFINEDKR